MSKIITTILFDMDGVLIDAKEWHYKALNKALELFGLKISRYEHLQVFDGLPTKEKLKMIGERYYLPETLYPFINEIKQSYTIDFINRYCHPVFAQEYALSKLKAEGYNIAVCSNSIRKTVEIMMEKSGLIPYIDLIISNEDVSRSKPDPEIYHKAMNMFHVTANECVICEDNVNGIKAAILSGGNLLKISDVSDTNYFNIKKYIHEVESND